MTLRRGFTAALIILLLASLAVPAAFAVITTHMQELTLDLGHSVESVRLAEDSQVNLLLHSRTTDDAVRARLGRQLRSDVELTQRYISNPREADIQAQALRAVDAYLAAPVGSSAFIPLRESAFTALEELTRVNVEDARATEARATRWTNLSDLFGLLLAGAAVVVVGLLLWWIRWQVIRPVLATSAAMEAFRRGDRSSRAPVEGPEEIALVARSYNEMADEIESERGRLQTFLGSVVHDLRNPLSALKLTTSRPLDRNVPQERLLKTVDLVRRQVERLDRMIGDLVDAARIERGELKLMMAPTDACALADEVVDLFTATSPNHRLRLDCPQAPVGLEADGSRVAQVLNNLVSNAIKYSPQGGEVVVAVNATDEDVVFRVTDQGMGMTPEEMSELFQPFRRVGLSRESIPGVGLGLYAVRRIVEAHHGRVSVASTPGRGSMFEVRLPRNAKASRITAGSEEAAPALH